MANYIGVCHVHSTYSEDGGILISDLACFFQKQQYNFVCLTDHNLKNDGSFINAEEMDKISAECKSVSSKNFVMIPGLECETEEGYHILALGVKQPIETKDCNEVISKIHEQGGIVVLAHPFCFDHSYPDELLERLDAIEVWNGKKNIYCPDIAARNLVVRLQNKDFPVNALFGLDLHKYDHFRQLSIIIAPGEGTLIEKPLSAETIIESIKSGVYILRSPLYDVGPRADFPVLKQWQWHMMGITFFKSRTALKKIQSFLERYGIHVPKWMLQYARQIYYQ